MCVESFGTYLDKNTVIKDNFGRGRSFTTELGVWNDRSISCCRAAGVWPVTALTYTGKCEGTIG